MRTVTVVLFVVFITSFAGSALAQDDGQKMAKPCRPEAIIVNGSSYPLTTVLTVGLVEGQRVLVLTCQKAVVYGVTVFGSEIMVDADGVRWGLMPITTPAKSAFNTSMGGGSIQSPSK